MKKILIIQTDSCYFLEESLRTIEDYFDIFSENDLTLLVDKAIFNQIPEETRTLYKKVIFDFEEIKSDTFDFSINLGTSEESMLINYEVKAKTKQGLLIKDGIINSNDEWAFFLLTIKANPPFLTFHLRDIYRNIMGFKGNIFEKEINTVNFNKIILGKFNHDFIKEEKFKEILKTLKENFPQLYFEDLENVDLVNDYSRTLYFGPPSQKALRLNSTGAKSIYLSSKFEGFNLIPYENGNYLINTNFSKFNENEIVSIISHIIRNEEITTKTNLSIYKVTHEYLYGTFLKSINNASEIYSFYQIHVILWIYVLNLFELNLDKNQSQKSSYSHLKEYKEVINYVTKLIDIGINSSEKIMIEVKREITSQVIIKEGLENLRNIEELLFETSNKLFFIRQFIDFYKIRRSTGNEIKMSEKAHANIVHFHEEKNVYLAFSELLESIIPRDELRP